MIAFHGPQYPKKQMEKVKAGLRGLNAAQKLEKGKIVLDALTGNPHFPFPVPPLTELDATCIELQEACIGALDRGRIACNRKEQAVAAMDLILSRLAGYVNGAAMGDSTRLISSGFDLIKRAEPRSRIEAPATLGTKRTFRPGEIELRWNGVAGALVYEVETVVTEERGWERVLMTSKPRATITGLEPNTWHTYRVRAIGTKAVGPFSQEIHTRSAA